MRIFCHLTYTDRLRIEKMQKQRLNPRQMADTLRVHVSTIYRELKRGELLHKNTDWTYALQYSPEVADRRYRINLAAKGPNLKIGTDHALAAFIEYKIVEDNYSPAAALSLLNTTAETTFSTTLCRATLYSYIDKGVFLRLSNKDLPMRGKRHRAYRHVRPARPPKGESIENRPAEINLRETFGHWEMDTVVGRKGTPGSLLVLTERLTRREIIRPLKTHTAASVVAALDGIERKYGTLFSQVFCSITVDNGSEFADCLGIEQSIRELKKRTKVYYCHPYSSWERGSNEKQNQMIRRRHPKGTRFDKVKRCDIQRTEEWLNHYPRAILGWASSAQLFDEQLALLRT